MNLALGITLLWLGAACLWVAFHGDPKGSKPWDVVTEVRDAIRGTA